ncbi:GAF and ANTAR domain-containing protein [Streptomyces sp. RKAG293]|uniref:GAF and ANTAR domain-containing protein n=1 Tax=Streptomyces sp. RKAG293 TaxID=2893403 RepID=UPI0020337CA5|nr:GAF and ANTAR domain-containing protein [Streptomyces sp. RKAG293]MCM2416976.1 GAF and ANTAR domain-containing protein [Streptomyces sp. RKAG293]
MISDRMGNVLRRLRDDDGPGGIAHAMTAGAVALGVDGLAVSLLMEDSGIELVACSDESAQVFEDLQFTLGEGPGPDTVRGGIMVWVPDLAGVRPDRWPALAMETAGLAARAVFCFPIGLGAIRVGVLTAVRRTPGPLSPGQADDALVLARALTARCLGGGEPRRQDPDDRASQDSSHELQQAVVHQATGMISVQLGLSLPQALLRLRGHAYGSGSTITDISREIVARRLRLDPNTDGTEPAVADKD